MTRTASLALLSSLLLWAGSASAQSPARPVKAELNKPAPDFTLVDLHGKTLAAG